MFKTILYFLSVVLPAIDAVKGIIMGVKGELKNKKINPNFDEDIKLFIKENIKDE